MTLFLDSISPLGKRFPQEQSQLRPRDSGDHPEHQSPEVAGKQMSPVDMCQRVLSPLDPSCCPGWVDTCFPRVWPKLNEETFST